MAKVILIWNEHPTEVVAGFHARKVARILREKYGHEVVMEKIPVAETNYAQFRTARPLTLFEKITFHVGHFLYEHAPNMKISQLGTKLMKKIEAINAEAFSATCGSKKSSIAIADEKALKHGTNCFNFHSLPAERAGNATAITPENFRIGDIEKAEIGLEESYEKFPLRGKKGNATIEIPAFYENLPKRLLKKQQRRTTALSQIWYFGKEGERPRESIRQYFFQRTPLQHPNQQKYLHLVISEKIAQAIHERISRK